MANIPAMLQGGQLAEAERQIEQLRAALKIPPAPPSGGPGTQNYAELNNAWKRLSQQASEKMAANPAPREALTKVIAGIPQMLQGGQLGEARKRLEQLQAAVKAAPVAPPSPPPQGARPAAGPVPGWWSELLMRVS
jgi:hypothetical protein